MRRRGLAVVDILLKVIPPNMTSRLSLCWSACWLSFLCVSSGILSWICSKLPTPYHILLGLQAFTRVVPLAFNALLPEANLCSLLLTEFQDYFLSHQHFFTLPLSVDQAGLKLTASFFSLLRARIRAEAFLLVSFMPTCPTLVICGGQRLWVEKMPPRVLLVGKSVGRFLD